jgi:hypothetical protein
VSFISRFGLLIELPISANSRRGLEKDMIAAVKAFDTVMMASVGRTDDESMVECIGNNPTLPHISLSLANKLKQTICSQSCPVTTQNTSILFI